MNEPACVIDYVRDIEFLKAFARYLEKAKEDEYTIKWLLNPKNEIVFDKEKGFVIFDIEGQILRILACYGDGKYWNEWVTQFAKSKGCNRIYAVTKRNVDTILRKYPDWKLAGYVIYKEVK